MSESTKTDLLSVSYIPQSEPLFTVRPRYYENLRRGSRGVRASFKLVSRRSPKFNTPTTGVSEIVRQKLFASNGEPYSDFLVTDLNYSFAEKMQLTQVFGDHTVAYAFGASPVILSINGVVTDDLDNDWFVRFIFLYKDYLRGTQMARNFELARLSMHNATFDGVVMGLDITQGSLNDAAISFRMQFLVRAFDFVSAKQYRQELVEDEATADALAAKIDGTFSYQESVAKAKSALEATKSVVGSKTSDAFSKALVSAGFPVNKVTELATNFGQKTISNPGGSDPMATIKNSVATLDAPVGITSGKTGSLSSNSVLSLQVVGVYASTLQTINSKLESVSGFLDSIKRNLEAFNRKVAYAKDPFQDITDLVAKAREQARKVTDIVSLVKQQQALLKQKSNIFANLKAELEGLRQDLRNAKGAVVSLNSNTVAKLSSTMRNNSSDFMPILGSSKAGISSESAALKLKSSNKVSVEDSLVLKNSSSVTSKSNADTRNVLTF